jgi:hypothetical protein
MANIVESNYSQTIIIKWTASNETRLNVSRVFVYRRDRSVTAASYVVRVPNVARLHYFRRTVHQVLSVP